MPILADGPLQLQIPAIVSVKVEGHKSRVGNLKVRLRSYPWHDACSEARGAVVGGLTMTVVWKLQVQLNWS